MMSIEKRKNGEFISRFQDVIRVQEALVSSILVLPIDAVVYNCGKYHFVCIEY